MLHKTGGMRPIHPDFQYFLDFKSRQLIELYTDLRAFLLDIYPQGHELLYHTHALSSVYSVSPSLGDAYCHIAIYTDHLNLGFNKGAILEDPHELLTGTGKWIRHIPVQTTSDYRRGPVEALVRSAVTQSLEACDTELEEKGTTISKITR